MNCNCEYSEVFKAQSKILQSRSVDGFRYRKIPMISISLFILISNLGTEVRMAISVINPSMLRHIMMRHLLITLYSRFDWIIIFHNFSNKYSRQFVFYLIFVYFITVIISHCYLPIIKYTSRVQTLRRQKQAFYLLYTFKKEVKIIVFFLHLNYSPWRVFDIIFFLNLQFISLYVVENLLLKY